MVCPPFKCTSIPYLLQVLLKLSLSLCANRPINQLVSGENANKKKSLVDWTEECQIGFEHLKHLCSQMPILA